MTEVRRGPKVGRASSVVTEVFLPPNVKEENPGHGTRVPIEVTPFNDLVLVKLR